jgi:hypothetical protein
MDINEKTLLLEYWKFQCEERRNHRAAEVNATAFLTGAAGVILGFTFRDGQPTFVMMTSGLIVFLVGLANWRINNAYFLASNYLSALGANTVAALEGSIKNWSVDKPSEIRQSTKKEIHLPESGGLTNRRIHLALMSVPFATMFIGVAVIIISILTQFRLFGFGTV